MFQTLTFLREHAARNKNNAEQNVYSMINLTEVQWPDGPHAIRTYSNRYSNSTES
jgi:hypothetical protein